MLGEIKESGGADWSVLIMDDVTTRVMSSCCRVSDLLDYGVSCKLLNSPISRVLSFCRILCFSSLMS